MAGRRRTTALIVEDARGENELAALPLGEFDLEVTQLASAQDALTHLCDSAEDVRVVLIDVHLEGAMDGIALARRVDVLWPTLSVILTSGDVAAAEKALPPRTTLIHKPWRPLDIVTAAERAARADHSLGSIQL